MKKLMSLVLLTVLSTPLTGFAAKGGAEVSGIGQHFLLTITGPAAKEMYDQFKSFGLPVLPNCSGVITDKASLIRGPGFECRKSFSTYECASILSAEYIEADGTMCAITSPTAGVSN